MQHGGGRANGKVDEIDEYFADRNDADESEASAPDTIEKKYHKDREEVRRLHALVTHLREQVGEIQSRPAPDATGRGGRSAFPVISLAGLLAVGLVGVLWTLQTRKFHRY